MTGDEGRAGIARAPRAGEERSASGIGRRPGRRLLAALALAGALLLGACGTTEAPTADPGGAVPAGEQITLTDARGTEITLDGPATRTVGLEWNVVEHLVSLGVMPVGVADVEGYTNWVQAAPLEGEVTDVGIRGEPSIDSIAALRPDLVLATTDLPPGAVSQIEAFAPVLVVRPADAADPIGRMRENLELVATATATGEQAERLLADFDAKLDDGRAAIAEAGLAGRPIAFADGFVDGGQLSIRPFTEGSLVGGVNTELGLVDAWPMEGDPDYGLASTDVEGLTNLPADTLFVYYANDAAYGGTDPFVQALEGNAVWQSLPFVRGGDVTRLPDGIWMFGGPSSMRQYVDALVAALTGGPQPAG
ncbi:MAG TPA: iron-siderophore ABC transporter substrate-binding protein [Pseudonocardia sp.]|jgi:ferric hydroxamate transport system substrate-binding protein|nr:iron-siderophore ABC transporter substrate-binding protein [Pseudonocardia sp.]